MGEGEKEERKANNLAAPAGWEGSGLACSALGARTIAAASISCRSYSTREGGHHHHHWVCWLARKCCRGCEGEREKLDNAKSAQSLALAGLDWALPGLL